MRQITELSINDMSPELRALVTYDPNPSLNVRSPHPIFERCLHETPVIRSELGVAFFRLDDIVEAARNPAIVSLNPATGVPFGMGTREPLIPLHIDGDEHRRFRRLLDPLLGPRQVAHLEPQIRSLADELIDGFVADGSVELHDAFCAPLPSRIFMKLFGLPLDDIEFLVESKERILHSQETTLEEHEAIGLEVGDKMRAHLAERLADRRARDDGGGGDDLIGRFLTFEVDGDRLSDDQILNIVHLFTIAGLDTVMSSLSCMFAWFAQHPDERKRVVAEPSLLPSAIEELLRYESPVPVSGPRWAQTDTEINGVAVKAGEMVVLCWATGNLDEGTFADPAEVNLERTENRHIAFAPGLHRCLGSHLARVELRSAIDQLHRRIPDYWVTPGDEVRYQSAGVRAAVHLPLTFAAP